MSGTTAFRKRIGTSTIVAVVSGALILVPLLQRPVLAQQSWAPPPAAGQPGYAPPGYAPPADMGRAAVQGVQDADADINGTLWFFVGCLGVIGIAIAYFAEPSPPPARLMGKSAEYIAIYTGAYKTEGKSIQGRHAIYGCLVGTVVVVAFYVVFFLVIFKTASDNMATLQ